VSGRQRGELQTVVPISASSTPHSLLSHASRRPARAQRTRPAVSVTSISAIHVSTHTHTHTTDSNRILTDIKGSPYSITERRVPELIPVLGSQSAGDVNHKNPAVGCHYFPPGLQLPPQSVRGLLPILLFGEQRHDGCVQSA